MQENRGVEYWVVLQVKYASEEKDRREDPSRGLVRCMGWTIARASRSR